MGTNQSLMPPGTPLQGRISLQSVAADPAFMAFPEVEKMAYLREAILPSVMPTFKQDLPDPRDQDAYIKEVIYPEIQRYQTQTPVSSGLAQREGVTIPQGLENLKNALGQFAQQVPGMVQRGFAQTARTTQANPFQTQADRYAATSPIIAQAGRDVVQFPMDISAAIANAYTGTQNYEPLTTLPSVEDIPWVGPWYKGFRERDPAYDTLANMIVPAGGLFTGGGKLLKGKIKFNGGGNPPGGASPKPSRHYVQDPITFDPITGRLKRNDGIVAKRQADKALYGLKPSEQKRISKAKNMLSSQNQSTAYKKPWQPPEEGPTFPRYKNPPIAKRQTNKILTPQQKRDLEAAKGRISHNERLEADARRRSELEALRKDIVDRSTAAKKAIKDKQDALSKAEKELKSAQEKSNAAFKRGDKKTSMHLENKVIPALKQKVKDLKDDDPNVKEAKAKQQDRTEQQPRIRETEATEKPQHEGSREIESAQKETVTEAYKQQSIDRNILTPDQVRAHPAFKNTSQKAKQNFKELESAFNDHEAINPTYIHDPRKPSRSNPIEGDTGDRTIYGFYVSKKGDISVKTIAPGKQPRAYSLESFDKVGRTGKPGIPVNELPYAKAGQIVDDTMSSVSKAEALNAIEKLNPEEVKKLSPDEIAERCRRLE